MHINHPQNLRFKCSRCGICCGDTPQKTRHVLLLKTEAERAAAQLNQPVSAFADAVCGKAPYVFEMHKNRETGKCAFLKDSLCQIYASRPLICRFYPFQLEVTEDGEATFTATDECPGVSRVEDGKEGLILDLRFFERLLRQARSEFGFSEGLADCSR